VLVKDAGSIEVRPTIRSHAVAMRVHVRLIGLDQIARLGHDRCIGDHISASARIFAAIVRDCTDGTIELECTQSRQR
jgi:hypothetical protein